MAGETNAKTSWTIQKLLEWTREYFGQAQLTQPRLTAEILLAHVLGCQRIDLYVEFSRYPTAAELGSFRALVKRAAAGEPAAYLTGRAHFFSLEFEVAPAVLMPRPETEVLAGSAIDFCRHETMRPKVDVLDLCTGSGCVAIAIGANVVETEIVAVDISPEALDIARRNIAKHDLEGRISLLQSDLFAQLGQAPKEMFDLIVSNPPYISEVAYETLASGIRDYEPSSALLAKQNGLEYHRRIVEGAERHLADEGSLMMETAFDQSEAVLALLEQSDYLTDVSSIRDNLGHPRVVKARKA